MDGQPSVELQLHAGDRRTFAADRALDLTVSDAAAIDVSINGAPSRQLAAPGERAAIRLTRDNYREYLDQR